MNEKQRQASDQTPFGVRLKAARKMAGLSMEDLAQKLGGMVTKQAIGKYEKGRMMPTPEVMERLIKVLQIATWGAGPLRAKDIEASGRRLIEPAPRMLTSRELPLLRRQGLLRLLRKNQKSADDEDTQARMCCLIVNSPPPSPQGEGSKSEDPSCVAKALPFSPEGVYASLAVRRARYMVAWGGADAALDQIRFREGERLPAKTKSALEYQVADHLQKYLELESILGLRAAFENPVVNLPVRTSDEVETAASEVRRRWALGSGPVVNLLGLLEDKGVAVYETRGIDGFDGLSGRFGAVPFVAVSRDVPADRLRFTAAHELAHILCEFSENESPEGMCHGFAAAFLLPRAALEKAFAPSRRKIGLGELGEVKEAFGISLQAIMYRAHALGFVSDRQLRAFRETVKAKGWTTTEPVEYAGKERAGRFRRLLHYAVAADILEVERAAEMAGVPAEEMKKEIGEI
ncbi:MAG: XRE family transcriptional regulator, partial [Candidatus Aminicenantes bacterium]|nr:XRE family transcriptional regulator [Candidatus Aminicenantes bacterium]